VPRLSPACGHQPVEDLSSSFFLPPRRETAALRCRLFSFSLILSLPFAGSTFPNSLQAQRTTIFVPSFFFLPLSHTGRKLLFSGSLFPPPFGLGGSIFRAQPPIFFPLFFPVGLVGVGDEAAPLFFQHTYFFSPLHPSFSSGGDQILSSLCCDIADFSSCFFLLVW